MKALIAALVIVVSAGYAFSEEKHAVPAIKNNCNICHTSHGDGKMLLNVSLKGPLSSLCLDCHPDRKAPKEHIVDIVPGMPVSNLLPLDGGKLTCTTCHDPHGKAGFPRMLRDAPGKLCNYCHKM